MSANSVTGSDPVIVELTAAVQKLAQRVDCLEEVRQSIEMRPPGALLARAMRAVQTATEVLFGGEVILDARQDPEIDEQYFVVQVKAIGSPAEVAERYRQWHRELGAWAPGFEPKFRLAVEFKDEK